MTDGYYRKGHLAEFGSLGDHCPELAAKFFDYYGAVMGDGALTRREKALIALGVAHAIQCPYCIDAYTKNSLQAGADIEQMTEAAHVAGAIRGGASLIHARQMQDHHDSISM